MPDETMPMRIARLEKKNAFFLCHSSRLHYPQISTAGRGPCGRPHPVNVEGVMEFLACPHPVNQNGVMKSLACPLRADGHEGRTLQWTFEDGRRYPAQEGNA